MTGGYSYSQPTITDPSNPYYPQEAFSVSAKTSGNLFGADIQFGYKQFFGKKRRFGLRYYGMFSGQGGSYIMKSPSWLFNTIGKAANLFYGVGVDAIYNFYEKNGYNLGVFAGVMIGGSSWLMGTGYSAGSCAYTNNNNQCTTMNEQYQEMAKADKVYGKTNFSPTFVQFIINIGFRTNFTKHQGVEVGVRIPTINDPYYTEKDTLDNGGDKWNLTFRRTIAIFANYVYNF
ncbi:outer membrane protein [Helicobacter labacensis]|uniref:outer membrane protein n=1 Tax=Helicobacter labacensis TaxID=2316079 RepID=UPI000EAC167A|nr:outer membrane protein [Helicobacter labacensis]